jgi:hypothetical protein
VTPARPQRPPRTLLEQIQRNTGSLRKTLQVGSTISAWAIAHRELGHTPLVHEYASYWKISERTAWREMARFKEAFPHEDNPDRLAVHVLCELDHDEPDAAQALSSPPLDLAL